MKILMTTMSFDIGGAETHILELCRELSRRGHEVTVASKGGVFVAPLTESGIRHVTAPLHKKDPASLLRSWRTLDKLIREENFDVIHSHARIPSLITHHLAKKYDIPFVTTFHYTFDPVWYLKMLTRTGERMLAVSDDLKRYLVDVYHRSPKKIDVTVNGIDIDQFDGTPTDNPLPEMGEGDKIVCVTRMDRAVAWHAFRLTEAMPRIVEAHPDARLILIGGGDCLDELKELAERIDAQIGGGHIFVLGPRSDIAKILPQADVFVGVSRAAMEAMACRKPVVLTGAQGHLGIYTPELEEEAISTNFCCRTRDAADADTIGDNVIEILAQSPARRREMGEYNRDVIARCYSVSRMAEDALAMYDRALREHIFRRPDVVISGYYGSGNTGDDALLLAITDGLHRRGIDRVAALCGKSPLPVPGVKRIPRFSFPRVRREIRGAKMLISGGGSLLQDATSTKSLIYYTWVIGQAKRAGVRVMIYANGIGPIEREKNRIRAADAVASADYISVREDASREELIRMGIPAERIHVSADPVFGTAADASPRATEDYIVLSLRETAGNTAGSIDCRNMEETVADTAASIAEKYGLSVMLIPMQPSYDNAICSRTAVRLMQAGIHAAVLPHLSPADLKEKIGGARAVIGMRLHTLIFAATENVPALALSYDPKVDAFMDYIGWGEHTLPAFTADGETIARHLTDLLEKSGGIRAEMQERLTKLADLARGDLDRAAEMLQKNQ